MEKKMVQCEDGRRRQARIQGDPKKDGDFSTLENEKKSKFDLVLSAFTFDNIPTMKHKANLFSKIGGLLNSNGKIVSIVSSPKIYLYEWESFSTKNYPVCRFPILLTKRKQHLFKYPNRD